LNILACALAISWCCPVASDLFAGGQKMKASNSSAPGKEGDKDSAVISYSADKVIGNGSFGVVFKATKVDTGEVVAIKKVLQDKRFKNRELQIMRMLTHPCVVPLKHCFYSSGEEPDETYLNLVLEFIPETIYMICRRHSKAKQFMPIDRVKMYSFQLLRSLAYIHALGVCHRDIKPQNLLVNPETVELKLCDFGSAKQLVQGEPNVSYICSRYYRAPECIIGATHYNTQIDTWSAGCVITEMLLGHPLFPGESGVDQLVEIIKVLGTPTREQIEKMNPNYTEFKFPQIKAHPWRKVFHSRVPEQAVDLVSQLLLYCPDDRTTPMAALMHPFFDELKEPDAVEKGIPIPARMFEMSPDELRAYPELCEQVVPAHLK